MTIPPIDPALVPADVRKGGPQATQRYAAALDLENQFLQQLTQQLTQTVEPDSSDDGSDDSDGASVASGMDPSTNPYLQMLPQALADGLTAAGGTGLADDLYRAITLGAGGAAGSAGSPKAGS